MRIETSILRPAQPCECECSSDDQRDHHKPCRDSEPAPVLNFSLGMYFGRLRLVAANTDNRATGSKCSSTAAAGITSGTVANPAPVSATGLQVFAALYPIGRNIDRRRVLNTLVCADVAGYVAEMTLARRDTDERTKP